MISKVDKKEILMMMCLRSNIADDPMNDLGDCIDDAIRDGEVRCTTDEGLKYAEKMCDEVQTLHNRFLFQVQELVDRCPDCGWFTDENGDCALSCGE
jgi:hypothetical protein